MPQAQWWSLSGADLLLERLLRAAREAEKQGSKHYETIVETIQLDHVRAAEDFIRPGATLDQLKAEISKECQDLSTFLEATQVRIDSRGRIMTEC